MADNFGETEVFASAITDENVKTNNYEEISRYIIKFSLFFIYKDNQKQFSLLEESLINLWAPRKK